MKTALTVVMLGALAVGGNLVYQHYANNMTALAQASMEWPSVSGLVTRSNLEFHRNEIGTGPKTEYRVEVTFEYVVGDQVYRNDMVRFDQGQLGNDQKKLLVSAHPVGKRVDVFYNPDDPDQSVLVPGSFGDNR